MWPISPRIAGIAAVACFVFAVGWLANGWRWQSKWDHREAEYSEAKAEAASLALQRQQLLNQQIRNIENEYLAELESIKSAPRPARVIRVCNPPAGMSTGGTEAGAGGADGGTTVRGGTGAAVGTDFDTGPLIDVGARCDAHVKALQGLLR